MWLMSRVLSSWSERSPPILMSLRLCCTPRHPLCGALGWSPGRHPCGFGERWQSEVCRSSASMHGRAKAALSMQINKSDRNDAAGIARIMQTGWYRQVQIKSPHSHAIRGLLNSRALLVKVQRDLENQLRGLLKSAGLIIGRAKDGVFSARTKALLVAQTDLAAIALPLLEAREAIHQQLALLERRVRKLAKEHVQTRAFMSVPGIGPMTAFAFLATIDDPSRFRRARAVGAYVGLTPRRYASGEVDWTGRISKCGDTMLRTYLFEAAGVLLTRVQKWCALKAWGLRLAKRSGMKKARTAVARKLAVILLRMWRDGTQFHWTAAPTGT